MGLDPLDEDARAPFGVGVRLRRGGGPGRRETRSRARKEQRRQQDREPDCQPDSRANWEPAGGVWPHDVRFPGELLPDGGRHGDRTRDLGIANAALSQLS